MDYFLSGELIEPAGGHEHYSEKLVKLPNVGFHYEPPEFELAAVTRDELGLRPAATVYWCAQSLFKYLPQHDDVFVRIAKELGDCQFVFIRHFGKDVTELFQQRLDRAFAAAGLKAEDHCVFLQSMEMSRFAAASAQCDVMLDSVGWSGGNTTLEALAQDLPVVTCQGTLMRGRVSAGILRMMGMPEAIAGGTEDYVALAIRAGPRSRAGGPGSRRALPATSTGSTATGPASPRWKIFSTAPRARNSSAQRPHCQRAPPRARSRLPKRYFSR